MSWSSGDLTHNTAGRGAWLGSRGPSFLMLQSEILRCCPEWGGAESPTGMAQGPAAARPGDERGAGRWGLRMQPCLGGHTRPRPQAARSRLGSGCDTRGREGWADGPELTAGHWGLEDTVCTWQGVFLPSPQPTVTLFPQPPLLLPPPAPDYELSCVSPQIHMLKP